MRVRVLAVILCETVALVANAMAVEIKIVANPSVAVSSVSAEDLRGIFLETRNTIGKGSHVEPVLLRRGTAHSAFLKDYIGKTSVALETYYRSLVFTGKASMPKSLGTDAEVLDYVARTKGAIGYVSAGADTAGVKVIEVR
jgi:hypothetical protein